MCLKTVQKLLDTSCQSYPRKECILDAFVVILTSNTCNFTGRSFTQTDGATIGGPESESVTDIFGAAFMNSKVQDNLTSGHGDWKRYRDESYSVSLSTNAEREIEKNKYC